MAFDYKKEYKEFYMPAATPSLVTVPPMNYIAVAGRGDPNAADSEYKQSIGLLYGVAYTLKMSKMTDHRMEGYFDYVVPPLEGFWWQEGASDMDYDRKEDFNFLSVIRLPDFVIPADVTWAVETATVKKKMDFSPVHFYAADEGLCVQCLHVGAYDDEPETVERMHQYMTEQDCVLDISDRRRHHEIYLSDARRVPPEKWKTVIRHPVKRI
jgi:hypothetical protein